MNLQARYDAMRAAAIRSLTQGEAELDALIDSGADSRRGITLLARPPAHIATRIEAVLADFRHSEPDQYYYPKADIHLTILSIIPCYSGFSLAMVDPAAYRRGVRTILEHTIPFAITFSGLTASPGGIMVQGKPHDDGLEALRRLTRKFFQQSTLQQAIDQRYSIQTAHSTVIRFKNTLMDPQALIEKIKAYEHHFFGTFEVDTLELVYHDWYQRANNTTLLERYRLKKLLR